MRTRQSFILLWALVSLLCLSAGRSVGAVEPAQAETAQAMSILWLSPADGAGADQISALKPTDSKVFAAATGISPTGSESFVARAYEGKSGSPQWIRQVDLGEGRNAASAVDTDGNRVFAVGRGEAAGGDSMFLVRAFDGKTGAPLWNETYSHGGDFNTANDVACKGSRVFAVGTGRTGSGADEIVVRAYVAKTGEVAWADAFSRGGGDSDGNAVAVNGSGVFVAGYTETAAQERMWAVRAYNQVNGSVLWTDLYSSGGRDIVAEHIAALTIWSPWPGCSSARTGRPRTC